MIDSIVQEWKIAGGFTGAVAIILSVVRLLRSSSAGRPPVWQRILRVGSAFVKLQVAEGEIAYLKLAFSEAQSQRDSERSERRFLQTENRELLTENRQLRMQLSGDPGPDSSAGSTSRRGASIRKKRTTSGTSDPSTQ